MIISNSYSIEVRNVSKMYKKYKTNFDKIIDLLGLPFKKNYEEFWPLKDINLVIHKGEKVGIIGRNGAGKTTLLSMIANSLQPTTGTIKVDGKVNALFVLGTGFHPEFSGRENIKSSLAFQGITGEEAIKIEKEVIEFSELEDFIDQPLKTYSAGMYTRLAFTVATAIKPEVLIIDEILGAGDAYFNAKALERMDKLTNSGATVLFVSHDLSSVQKICDRCIWIDKGKIREDGKTLDVIKSYSADVRRREELRLLSQNSGVEFKNSDNDTRQILFRFITQEQLAPKEKGLKVHKISLYIKDNLFSEILLGDSMDNSIEQDGYIVTNEKINWSKPLKQDDKWYREFKDLGGEYTHAIGIFNIPKVIDDNDITFKIEYFDDFEDEILFELYNDKEAYTTLLSINSTNSKNWINIRTRQSILDIDTDIETTIDDKTNKSNDIYGTGELIITKFQILDKNYEEKYVFTINDKIVFRIYYQAYQKIYKPVFVIAIYKEDGTVITQLIDKEKDTVIAELDKKGYVDFEIENLKIGKGEYLLSVGIFHDIDLTNPIEQDVYCLHDRRYKFKVEQPFGININLGILYQDFKVSYE